MKKMLAVWIFALLTQVSHTEDDGLAPEVTDLNAADVSKEVEDKIPYLEKPYISVRPQDLKDDIAVGELGVDGFHKEKVLAFAQSMAEAPNDGDQSMDSLLIYKKGKLIFEAYFRRGRINVPHYQMSITKSYTALGIGRAIAMGYLSMEDLHRPVLDFLKSMDKRKLVDGAETITLHDAMSMRSGIRVNQKEAMKTMNADPNALKGQGQIQTYLELSAPITEKVKAKFKYQGADPSIAMQVLEAVVPGTAREFMKNEVFGKMGITDYAWQDDTSGILKSAAGASLRSRDMLKIGMLVLQGGLWKGESLIPSEFVRLATSAIDVKPNRDYGYFWWGHKVQVRGRSMHCTSGRGAGGQYIFMVKDMDLIVVTTAHNKGMGQMLRRDFSKLLSMFH